MLFNSLPFLIFLPLFLLGFALTRGRARLAFTLAGSYLFYGWWDWRFLGLIILSTLVDYTAGRAMAATDDLGLRRRWLTLSVVTNLGILGFFKYANFFADSLVAAAHTLGIEIPPFALHVVLPVGVSFYTFQTMSYTLDLYRDRVEVEPSLLRFATFVAFFPQLVAGPIVRAAHLLPQLRRGPRWTREDVVMGVGLILLGFVKKVAIADSLAPVADRVFADPGVLGAPMLVLGVLFYAFQIYCDFSGYSDIAIGLGRILGFHFPWNFDRPYFSRSFSEFWTRWHITLSRWLRDYLYIPLGGNRLGRARTLRNLMVTMLLGGLWHGAAWTFVFWGGLHGLYLVAQRLLTRIWPQGGDVMAGALAMRPPQRARQMMRAFAQAATVFVLTCVAWVFFRAPDFPTAWTVLAGIGTWTPGPVVLRVEVAKGLLLIAALVAAEAVSFRVHIGEWLLRSPGGRILAYAALLWIIALAGTFDGGQFIYFQF
ncbi:MAG: MBOAT family O-acyltransferase [Gemmatimonadota bacterium]